jgi:hypothetical protein
MLIDQLKGHMYKHRIMYVVLAVLCVLFLNNQSKPKRKIVAFDLDETLGHFSELSIFMNGLERFIKRKLSSVEMFHIFDLYPEYFRPYILNCLAMLRDAKKEDPDLMVIIYTNNYGPKKWATTIAHYLEEKINSKLFDRIIGIYKWGNVTIEKMRTTQEKTMDDLKRVMRLDEQVNVCFVDNLYHEKMKECYYIHCEDYVHSISFAKMIERFIQATPDFVRPEHRLDFRNIMLQMFDGHKYEKYIRTDKDMETSQAILTHLTLFLKDPTKKCCVHI